MLFYYVMLVCNVMHMEISYSSISLVIQYANCHDNIIVSFLINKVFQITLLKKVREIKQRALRTMKAEVLDHTEHRIRTKRQKHNEATTGERILFYEAMKKNICKRASIYLFKLTRSAYIHYQASI